MKTINCSAFITVCLALSLFTSACDTPATAPKAVETMQQPIAKPADMTKVKAEIQALENSWAEADNTRNANALSAFYSDDAISLGSNKPMEVGKAAIQKGLEAAMAKRVKGRTVAYEIMDVFGDENQVTEVGKTTAKDAAGKVIYTGKYMAIWEKRNGKYLCVRDISNDDVKEK